MGQQQVWLGQLVLDREPPIDLHVEVPAGDVRKKAAWLKHRLAFLLDTRFQPSPPEPKWLTVEQVAAMLDCRCRTVLRMIRQGKLHPIEENGDVVFDREEIEGLRHVPIGDRIARLIPRS